MFRFKECREAAGLSQKYVALMLGVKAPSIVDWEKGRTNPTCDKLVALANLYRVTVDELLNNGNTSVSPDPEEQKLVMCFRRLNADGQKRLLDLADDMTQLDKWTQKRDTKAV